jgi:3-isopropylmalate/(R)-2-methylmalate dehydratase small subunit
MNKISEVHGSGIYVTGNDIDTDRIIPARFMKCVTFDDLGQYAFHDVRYDDDGNRKDHPFNDPAYSGASILVVQKNFGCGSSREHAPQALMRYGIKALIGESFAEIFAGNCIANGVPVVLAQQPDIENLIQFIKDDPACQVTIDLENKIVEYGDFIINVDLQTSHRNSLLDGSWDTTSEMVGNLDETRQKVSSVTYLNLG